jgi:hypothetical protein
MEEQKERKMLINIIKSLQTLSTLQNRVHIMGMRSDNISITLGLPPKATLNFKKIG